MKFFVRLLSFVLLATVAIALYATFRTPGHLYRHTGVFADCPARPSCVSSVATDPVHRIEPLRYEGDPLQAQARLVAAVRSLPGSRIEQERADYLHVLFTTPKMRFRDDLELLIEPGGKIQVRSISRFGYRDRGVNRDRVEALRTAYADPAPAAQ
jgi:uncharacterized protein (DUF1499 family)